MLEEENKTIVNEDEEIDVVAELQKQLADEKAKNQALSKEKNRLARDILNNNKEAPEAPKEEKVVRSKADIQKDFYEAKNKRDMLRVLELSKELDDAYEREEGRSSYLPRLQDKDDMYTADEELIAKKAKQGVDAILKEIGTNMNTYSGGDRVKLQKVLNDYYSMNNN